MHIDIVIDGKRLRLSGLSFNFVSANPPPKPQIVKITFAKGPNMAALLGTVHLSPGTPDLTSRTVTITINGGDPFTIDMIIPTATFPCNEGDTVVGTAVDSNAFGPSPASPPLSVVAAVTVTGPPAAPTIMDFSFVPA